MKIYYDKPNLLVEPRFKFKGTKDGFLAGYSPFIRFDRCHLKGTFRGILLNFVALDGNNSLFPLAFAIVDHEIQDTWSWFFYYFQELFGPFPANIPLAFMSDRQEVCYLFQSFI